MTAQPGEDVGQNRPVRHRHQGLGPGKGQRPQPRALSTGHHDRFPHPRLLCELPAAAPARCPAGDCATFSDLRISQPCNEGVKSGLRVCDRFFRDRVIWTSGRPPTMLPKSKKPPPRPLQGCQRRLSWPNVRVSSEAPRNRVIPTVLLGYPGLAPLKPPPPTFSNHISAA